MSGGQESDHGSIGGQTVLEARKDSADIIYRLVDDHGLKPGQAVDTAIDWTRRYRLMRLHFAAEIVLELAYTKLPGVEKIGAHIAADKARIDFIWPEPVTTLLPQLEKRVNEIVMLDLPIVSGFSDQDAGRRYWEITGFAQVPCRGTHLHRTGEIGSVSLKRRNIGKGKERIEVYLDEERS
jgi:Ser-tRNA(Ala) deacylase AlaX